MDVDINPFDERGKADDATGGEDETIPLIPGGGIPQITPMMSLANRKLHLEERD